MREGSKEDWDAVKDEVEVGSLVDTVKKFIPPKYITEYEIPTGRLEMMDNTIFPKLVAEPLTDDTLLPPPVDWTKIFEAIE